MGFLMGSSAASTPTKYIGIPVQTSIKGSVIQWVWGTTKVGCNLLEYLDFRATPHDQTAGKGGSYKSTTFTYQATVLLGICHGPIAGIRTIWRDQSTFANGSTTALAQAGLNLASGNIGQTPWGYLTTNYPDHALGYSHLAYVYAANYSLNDSATIPNHSFEVQSTIRQVIAGVTADDANPQAILEDSIPHIPRWPTGALGDLTDYGNYCLATGLLLSPLLDSQTQWSEFVKSILSASNSDCVWSDGFLKVIPYGDTVVMGNGVTWTPNLTPTYDFDWGDIYSDTSEDPIRWDFTRPSDAYNIVQISYLDRTAEYAEDVMPAQDPANIESYGERKEDPQTMHSICLKSVAATVAQLRVQRKTHVRRTCQFEVGEKFNLLEPQVDLVTVPLRNGKRRLLRITGIEEKPDEASIVISAEEMLVGVSHSALYSRQGSQGATSNSSVSPGNTIAPAIFDVPVELAKVLGLETWVAVCSESGNSNWGGCQVWVSTDGVTYGLDHTIIGASRMGLLTASLASGSDPDTSHTLAVDLSNSMGIIESGTTSDADNGTTLCFISDPDGTNGEYVAYSNATLTASYKYNLDTYLRRGFHGSAISAHASGSRFVRLDGSIGKIAYNASDMGRTLYVKLLSFNVYGQALQQLSDVTAYTHVIGGPPFIGSSNLVSRITGLTTTSDIAAGAISTSSFAYIGDGVTTRSAELTTTEPPDGSEVAIGAGKDVFYYDSAEYASSGIQGYRLPADFQTAGVSATFVFRVQTGASATPKAGIDYYLSGAWHYDDASTNYTTTQNTDAKANIPVTSHPPAGSTHWRPHFWNTTGDPIHMRRVQGPSTVLAR